MKLDPEERIIAAAPDEAEFEKANETVLERGSTSSRKGMPR